MAGEKYISRTELRMIADDGSPQGYPPLNRSRDDVETEPTVDVPYGKDNKPAPDFSKITREIAESTNVA